MFVYRSFRYSYRWWLVAVVLLGFGLRLWGLDRHPLRGDEAFTVQYWVMIPVSETIERYLTVDPQPLLAYVFFNAWGSLLGVDPFAMRLLPVLFGTVGIVAMFAFGRRATGSVVVGLLSALMWSLHPFAVWHSQDIRNYSLWSSVSVLSIWLGLCAVYRGRRWDWILFVSLAALAGYLYYLDLFVLFALSIAILGASWGCWDVWLRWIVSLVFVGLLLAPWYVQPALLSGGGYGGTTIGFDVERLFVDFSTILSFGFIGSYPAIAMFVLFSLLLSVFFNFWLRVRSVWVLVSVAFVPLMLLSFVSLRLNVLAPRYVLVSASAWVVLFSSFVVLAWFRGRLSRFIGVAFGVVWFGLTFFSLFSYYNDYTKSPAWDVLASYLSESVQAGDLVIQAAADASFGYYYHVVEGIEADERALPAEPTQPVDEIEQVLAEARDAYDSVWLVAQGFTDWPNYGVVDGWLDANMQLVTDTTADGLRIQRYKRQTPEVVDGAQVVRFGDVAGVVDTTLLLEPQPTGEIVVWVVWERLEGMEGVKAFVHLIGPTNPETGTPLWRQHDLVPSFAVGGGAGSYSRDVFVLPDVVDLEPGEYELVLGLYDSETGDRVGTSDGQMGYRLGGFRR